MSQPALFLCLSASLLILARSLIVALLPKSPDDLKNVDGITATD